MTLPKQAQRQADEARRLQEQVVNPEASPEAPPAEPGVLTVDGEQTSVVVAADPSPAPAANPEPWEERYHILEGKYNAEVPRQQAQIRALTEQLADMQQLIATMQNPPQPDARSDDTYGATPSEIEKFGADLVEFIGRVVRAEVLSASTRFQQQLDGVKGEVTQVTQQQVRSAEQEFYDYLDQHIPDWPEVNKDVRFLKWLAEPAPFTRTPKQELLADAAKAYDGPGAAKFFITFKEEFAPPPAPTPVPEQPSGLESQVQPGRRSAATGNAPPAAGKIITRAEVTQFYTEVARGVWTSRPQEKAQREAEIFAAQREGRIA